MFYGEDDQERISLEDKTHQHHKKASQIVQKIKNVWGYSNNVQEASRLYNKKILNTSKPLNPNFLKEEEKYFNHQNKVNECVAAHSSVDENIPLQNLLDGTAKGDELNRMREKIRKQFLKYNKIMEGGLSKNKKNNEQVEDKQVDNAILSDSFQFNRIMTEIKELLSNANYYQMLIDHIKTASHLYNINETNRNDTPKNPAQKDMHSIMSNRDAMVQEASNKVIEIRESHHDVSDILKQQTISNLQSMLCYLDEISNSDEKYDLFLEQCINYQHIYLQEMTISHNKQSFLPRYEEDLWIDLPKQIKVSKKRSNDQRKKLDNNDNIENDITEEDDSMQKQDQDSTTNKSIEFLMKIQQRYEKNQRKRLNTMRFSLNQNNIYQDQECISLEFQQMEKYSLQLSQLLKLLSNSIFQEVQCISEQISHIKCSLDRIKLQIAGNSHDQLVNIILTRLNKTFTCQSAEITILQLINIIKSFPDYSILQAEPNSANNNTSQQTFCNNNKITNYHIGMQSHDIKPILQRINPHLFLDTDIHIKKMNKTQNFYPKQRSVSTVKASNPNKTVILFKNNMQKRQEKQILSKRNSFTLPNNAATAAVVKSAAKKLMIGKRQIGQNEKKQQLNDIINYMQNSFDVCGENENQYQEQNEILIQSLANKLKLQNIFAEKWNKVNSQEAVSKFRSSLLLDNTLNLESQLSAVILPKQTQKEPITLQQTQNSYLPVQNKTLPSSPTNQLSKPQNMNLTFNHPTESEKQQFNCYDDQKQENQSRKLKNKFNSLQPLEDSESVDKNKEITDSQNITQQSKSYSFRTLKSKQSPHTTRESNFISHSTKNEQKTHSINFYGFKQTDKHSLYQSERKTSVDTVYGQQLMSYSVQKKSKEFNMTTSNFTNQLQGMDNSYYQNLSKDLRNSFNSQQEININTQSKIVLPLSERKETLPVVDEDNLKEIEKIVQKRKQQEELERVEAQMQIRKQLITKILNSKRPTFYKLISGGRAIKTNKEEVINIEQNINFVQKKTKQQSLINNRQKLQTYISDISNKLDLTNIHVLQGPPKKHYVETSSLKVDFHDKVICSMLNH